MPNLGSLGMARLVSAPREFWPRKFIEGFVHFPTKLMHLEGIQQYFIVPSYAIIYLLYQSISPWKGAAWGCHGGTFSTDEGLWSDLHFAHSGSFGGTSDGNCQRSWSSEVLYMWCILFHLFVCLFACLLVCLFSKLWISKSGTPNHLRQYYRCLQRLFPIIRTNNWGITHFLQLRVIFQHSPFPRNSWGTIELGWLGWHWKWLKYLWFLGLIRSKSFKTHMSCGPDSDHFRFRKSSLVFGKCTNTNNRW